MSGAMGRSALGVVSQTVTKIMCKFGPVVKKHTTNQSTLGHEHEQG